MKSLEIILLFILLSYCFNFDNSEEIDENYNPISDEDYDDSSLGYNEPSFPSNSKTEETEKPDIFNQTELNPKIILVAFENYTFENGNVTFYVLFKIISGLICPRYLQLTLHFISEANLRYLNEEVKTTECERITEVNEDNIRFNCSEKTKFTNITQLFADKNFSLLNEDGFAIEELETPLSGYAQKTIQNIQNETGQKKFYYLINSTKFEDQDNLHFYVKGKSSEDLENQAITLNIYEENEGKIIYVPCNINDTGNELHCFPKRTIKANLDNADGTISKNEILIISMKEKNDIISLGYNKNENDNKNSSKKRLSGGAIAAIVISSCIMIIVITLALLHYKRQPKVPIQPKEIDMVSSNSSGNNVSQ